jgi:serine/threonine-protein kinase
LHTAHELGDHDGVALNLVHRDVSPSNVLITYDGAVKLLDFGIAQADDRRAQTQAGQIKGKLQYMSPEQCLRYTLDRRSDVFALGILLFELCTMRRLFERKNDLDVLRAICEEPVPAPSSIAPDVPAAVDAICLRALSRKRDARYPTAAEMRRELLATARTLDTDAVPEEALARLMQRLFADRIEHKHDMLRRFRAGSTPTQVPPAEVDEHVVVPSIVADAAPDVDRSVTGETVPRPPAPRPRRALSYGILVACAVVVGTLAIRWAPGRSSGATESAQPAPPPATSTAAPILATTEATAPVRASPAASVAVRVEATPAAEVRVGDEPRGRTPTTVLLARGDEPIEIVLERQGYLRWERSIVPSVDQQLVVTLVPRPRPATPPARSSKPPPPQIPLFR